MNQFGSILVAVLLLITSCHGRMVMYLTGQHNVVPEDGRRISSITHVILAFMSQNLFNSAEPAEWPLFTTVDKARSQFAPETKIMVATGGWGDTNGFAEAAATPESMQRFANNIAAMVQSTGADGIDIDWEYPGGNGEDYKLTPNAQRTWEIEAYPKLLAAIRAALGPNKIMSAAVPGLPRDMLAFTAETMTSIDASLDFWNIMTYDLMNRRDSITKHHTGIKNSLESIDAYIAAGVPPEKMNLGFAFYVKWFSTAPEGGCEIEPIGCRTVLLEDPTTGADLGGTGGFSWHDSVPMDRAESFERAQNHADYDDVGGGTYYYDETENLWWTWDNPEAIKIKFPQIVEARHLGGVFAWGLGEDAPEWRHLQALTHEMNRYMPRSVDSPKVNPYDRVEL